MIEEIPVEKGRGRAVLTGYACCPHCAKAACYLSHHEIATRLKERISRPSLNQLSRKSRQSSKVNGSVTQGTNNLNVTFRQARHRGTCVMLSVGSLNPIYM